MIKILIVDDSPVRRKVLEYILSSDTELQIIGFAKNSQETLKFLEVQKPDLITMDINIPGGINGFELTKMILNEKPIPIIIISGIRNIENRKEVEQAMMQSGALHFIDSPPGPWSDNFDAASKNIIHYAKLLGDSSKSATDQVPLSVPPIVPLIKKNKSKLVLIGVSTGGPAILKEIISSLPIGFKTPIVIAQHISVGFDKLLVNQLNKESNIPLKVLEDHEKITPGTCYFAPASKITEILNDEFTVITPPDSYKSHLPSISALFASAISYFAENLIGIILTGMGNDGVAELKMIKENGGTTIAQDQASCIVYGMPKEAASTNAATLILNPKQIADFLISFDKK